MRINESNPCKLLSTLSELNKCYLFPSGKRLAAARGGDGVGGASMFFYATALHGLN